MEMTVTRTFQGWSFSTFQSLIGSEAECSEAERVTGIHPLPDMFFAKSSVSVSSGSFCVNLTPNEALRHSLLTPIDSDLFAVADFKRLKVKAAEKWKAANAESTCVLGDIKEVVLDHDWTFTTSYTGDLTQRPGPSVVCRSSFLPKALLTDQQLPILFYDEIVFWEDELHDNGLSKYSVRIRVTEKYWYLLALFSLKLDGVADREISSRYFHEFGSACVLREVTVGELSRVFQDVLELN